MTYHYYPDPPDPELIKAEEEDLKRSKAFDQQWRDGLRNPINLIETKIDPQAFTNRYYLLHEFFIRTGIFCAGICIGITSGVFILWRFFHG